VKSHTTPEFRQLLAALPAAIRRQAREAYRVFRTNPRHPGLHFKRVHGSRRAVSARVGINYRAVGALKSSGHVIWFWIGPHDEYVRLLKGL
jgi:hypothetical protein